MHTNGHEYPWTCLAAMTSRDEGRERGRPARTTLAQPHPSPPPGSTGKDTTIPLQPSPWGSRRQGGRAPHHGETERPPNPENAGETPALPEGASSLPSCSARRHCSCRCGSAVPLRVPSCVFVDSSFFRLPPPCRADHMRVKHSIVNQGEPRMHTNGHEYPWTCLAAMTSRDQGRERGRPARTTLAQPHPSLPPGSTGNSATIPLQPSPWGSRRQGGRAPHHGETERPPNPENAGETPALPVGRLLPSFLLREEALLLPMRQCRSASCAFVCLRRFLFFSVTPALPGGSYEGETLNRQSRRTTNAHEWTRIPMDLLGCDDVTG